MLRMLILSRKKAKSDSKIPCIKFSKGREKRSNHSKIIEDSDRSVSGPKRLKIGLSKTLTQSDDQTTKSKSALVRKWKLSHRKGMMRSVNQM